MSIAVQAQTIEINYPDEITGEPGDILEFPIAVSNISAADNVVSLTFIFEFQNEFIADIQVDDSNSISPFEILGNRNMQNSDFRIGGFGMQNIVGSGILFTLIIELGQTLTGSNQFFEVTRAHLNGLNAPPFLSPAAPIEIPLIIGSESTDISFANIDRPAAGVIEESEEFEVFGSVEVPGVTNASFESNSIEAWIGYNTLSTDPSGSGWAWVPAVFTLPVGNNRHEYKAEIGSTLPPGDYVYVTRFRYNGGDFFYGGFNNGFWDGTTNVFGQLQVLEFTNIEQETVTNFRLGANYPNPFNPVTVIPFSLESSGRVTLNVYDVHGRLIDTLVDQTYPGGSHSVRFDASAYSSGVYFYQLRSGGLVDTRKMLLVK